MLSADKQLVVRIFEDYCERDINRDNEEQHRIRRTKLRKNLEGSFSQDTKIEFFYKDNLTPKNEKQSITWEANVQYLNIICISIIKTHFAFF